VPTDVFSHADMLVMFDYWMTMTGSEKVSLTRAALKDELEYHLIRGGAKYDKKAKLFTGAVLR